MSTDNQRYLSFSLGQEAYAIPLLSVREVLAIQEFTPVPQTPAYFMGIMNLRGQVLSVMDLRVKLGIKAVTGPENAVILCQVGDICVGIAVDSVNSVIAPEDGEMSPTPEGPALKNAAFVEGVYRKDKQIVLLLDVGKALSLEDYQLVKQSTKSATAA